MSGAAIALLRALPRRVLSRMGSVLGIVSEETPPYEVVAVTPAFEVRRYAAGVAIEARDEGFGDLAGYIGVMRAPQNAEGRKIAMTAPVVSLPDAPGGALRRMQFILPAADAARGPPAPSRPDAVAVVARPPATMVVASYGGSWDAADARRRAADLADAARRAGHAVPADLGAWEWRRFNPPWTPGFLKRNEVCVPVEG